MRMHVCKQATTWNSDIKCWKLPRYDRSNYNIINDGNASTNKDNEIACIKGNIEFEFELEQPHFFLSFITTLLSIEYTHQILMNQIDDVDDDDNEYRVCSSLLLLLFLLSITIPGGAAIKKYAVLNDKRHILTKDTDNNVAIYDVLKVTKVKDLGPVDFDNELNQHNQKVFIPNWFTVDLKTGVCNFFVFSSFFFSSFGSMKIIRCAIIC